MARFTSDTGRRARCRKAGLHSALYWRDRDFVNLVKARAVLAARRERDRVKHTTIPCSAVSGLWHCTCGLSGRGGEASIFAVHRKVLGLES